MQYKFILLLSSAFLFGCGDNNSTPDFKVNATTATNFPYTLENQPAVSVAIKQDGDNFCEVTLFRNNVREGYSATLSQKSSGELSSSCYWKGAYFTQSSKHPTIAQITVESLDEKTQTAVLKTTLKLVNNKTLKDYFELKDIQFSISGDQYVNLTTMPSN